METCTPMSLLFVISSLTMGGAERVLTLLAASFAKQGHTVSIVTLAAPDTKPHWELPSSIDLVQLDLTAKSRGILSGIAHNSRRILAIRRQICQRCPNIVISFVDQLNALSILATLGTGIPIVVSERSAPSRHYIGQAWEVIRRITYPLADRVVTTTERGQKQMERLCKCNCTTIPNPVEDPGQVRTGRGYISVGRLSWEKGHADLVRAYALLNKATRSRKLIIVGDGPEMQNLKDLSIALGVGEDVIFEGCVDDPITALCRADIFVLPSRYEGFPNALCEAMSCGLAPVAYDCMSGPAEILEHGRAGILVPEGDVQALTQALHRMSEGTTSDVFGGKAIEAVKRYSAKTVLSQWQELFKSVQWNRLA